MNVLIRKKGTIKAGKNFVVEARKEKVFFYSEIFKNYSFIK